MRIIQNNTLHVFAIRTNAKLAQGGKNTWIQRLCAPVPAVLYRPCASLDLICTCRTHVKVERGAEWDWGKTRQIVLSREHNTHTAARETNVTVSFIRPQTSLPTPVLLPGRHDSNSEADNIHIYRLNTENRPVHPKFWPTAPHQGSKTETVRGQFWKLNWVTRYLKRRVFPLQWNTPFKNTSY
jgi:hypothetical protein